MRFYLFAILLLFTSLYGYSSNKDHYITLNQIDIPIKNFGFDLISVTNATGYERFIGYVQKTISYKAVPTYFEQESGQEIYNFLQRNIEATESKHSVIVRLNKLQITETYNGINETATAKLNLTFIYKEADQYFEKFTIGALTSKSAAAGVSKSLPINIAKAIVECFEIFEKRAGEGKLSHIKISNKDLYIKKELTPEEKQSFLLADRSIPGLYTTYFDFRDNITDTTRHGNIFYTTNFSDGIEKIKYARIEDMKTGKKIKEIWGFTDGERVYTRIGKKYFPLQSDSSGFYIELKMQEASAYYAAGMLGGLIGSAIASASAPVKKLSIDYYSGELDYSDQYINSDGLVADEYAIRFFSSSFNADESRLELYIDNEYSCTLKTDTWYQHKLTQPVQTIELIVKSVNGFESTKTITTKSANQDLYLIIDKKRKAAVINKVATNDIDRMTLNITKENRIY